MVQLYTNGCVRCGMVKRILEEKGIEMEIISDKKIIEEIAKKENIMLLPFVKVKNEYLSGLALQQWIKEQNN